MPELPDTEQERYQRYLCSREWGLLKEQVHSRSRGTCERCRSNPGDAVHHVTYIRKYCETLDDLIHLCEPCHSFIHGRSDVDPCEPTFETVVVAHEFGGMSMLHCPYCRSEYDCLHHGVVVVYNRDEEDGDVTEIAVVGDKTVQRRMPDAESDNPSARRDGLAIQFYCENCGKDDFELTISQHKGSTFLVWRQHKAAEKKQLGNGK